jgi:hypothetical protein
MYMNLLEPLPPRVCVVPCTTVTRKTLQDPQRKISRNHGVVWRHKRETWRASQLSDAFGQILRIPPNCGVKCDSPAYLNTTFKFPVTISSPSSLWWANCYAMFNQVKVSPYVTPLQFLTGTRFGCMFSRIRVAPSSKVFFYSLLNLDRKNQKKIFYSSNLVSEKNFA